MTEPRNELAAGGVVVRQDGDAVWYLLICDVYQNWGLPKGHVEGDETVEAAAEREVREETGLIVVAIIAPLDVVTWEFSGRGARVRKTCHFFLMRTAEVATRPQRDEGISMCRWATFEDAERLMTYENARIVLRSARDVLRGLDGAGAVPRAALG